MSKIITLPEHIQVRSADLKGAQTHVSTEAFTPEFVIDAIAYMWDVRIQRSQAAVDKDDPDKDSKKAQARRDMFNRLSKGEVIKGGGGGGAKLSIEDRAWIAFFKAQQIKEGGKEVNGKTLLRAQESLCRQDLIAEHDPGTEERLDVERNIKKHLDERFDDWKEACESDPEDIGAYISLEKQAELLKKTPMKRRR